MVILLKQYQIQHLIWIIILLLLNIKSCCHHHHYPCMYDYTDYFTLGCFHPCMVFHQNSFPCYIYYGIWGFQIWCYKPYMHKKGTYISCSSPVSLRYIVHWSVTTVFTFQCCFRGITTLPFMDPVGHVVLDNSDEFIIKIPR